MMSWISILPLAILAFALSWLLTLLVRRLALRYGILDFPNERSMHCSPVARGGGIAFVVVTTAAVLVWGSLHLVPWRDTAALLCAIPVAIVGLVDDWRSVPAPVRLCVQCGAAALAIAWMPAFPALHVNALITPRPVTLVVLALIALVWFTNLFNFMDGIDGIASIECTTATVVCALLVGRHSNSLVLPMLPLVLLGAAVLGFLPWNWSPARIYMGDAGSGFLGFTLGVLAFLAALHGQLSIWVFLIVTAVFVVDATATLMVRMFRGERWYAPHRSHGFQRAAMKWGHWRVSVGVGLINLFWLAPMAMIADAKHDYAPLCTLIAWTPLLLLDGVLGAGKSSIKAQSASPRPVDLAKHTSEAATAEGAAK